MPPRIDYWDLVSRSVAEIARREPTELPRLFFTGFGGKSLHDQLGRDYHRSVDKVLAEVLKQPEPALSQPTSRAARDQLQDKRKQSALAQLSGKWEKR